VEYVYISPFLKPKGTQQSSLHPPPEYKLANPQQLAFVHKYHVFTSHIIYLLYNMKLTSEGVEDCSLKFSRANSIKAGPKIMN
jgi:hypothetical protein